MIKNPETILAEGKNLTTDGQRCAVKELISSYYYPSESYIDPLKVTLVYNFVQDNANRTLSIRIYSNEYFEYYVDMGPWDVAHSTTEIMDAIRKYINNGCKFEFQDKGEEDMLNFITNNAEERLYEIYKRLDECGYGGAYSISNNLLSISSSLGNRINKSVWIYVGYEDKDKIKSEIYIDGELKSTAFSFNQLFNSLRFYEIYGNCANNHKEDNKVTTYTMNDAVKMVLSEDYKERFIAEYVETKIRYERLHNIIIKWCAGKADFVTDIELLEEQAKHMSNYLKTLEIRAVKEDIELPNVDWRK